MSVSDLTAWLIDVCKFAFAGCIVAVVANRLFWPSYNRHVYGLRMLEAKSRTAKELTPLRLQAYERLVLLVERINPANMLPRIHEPELSAADFAHILINEIRSEYQHNLTQQLYVSDAAWEVTRQLKENTVALIRNALSGLPPDAKARELGTAILAHLATLAHNPYELAVKTIKNELGG